MVVELVQVSTVVSEVAVRDAARLEKPSMRESGVQYWALVDGLILGRQDAWRPGTILVVASGC